MKLKGKRFWPSLLADLFLLLLLFSYTSTAAGQAPGTFIRTGDMTMPRSGQTATLLLNGKVLIAGGDSGVERDSGVEPVKRLPSAELFDPITGTFTATGNMITGRSGHSATLLPDGRVLVASGGTAELYDPSTGTFTATGDMVSHLYGQTATLLNNGKVLIAGGGTWCPSTDDGCWIVDNPEIYDPATGKFTATGDYADKSGDSFFGTAGLSRAPTALLADGDVLIAGYPTAELYDPVTGSFRLTGRNTGVGGLYASDRRAISLANGKVLVADSGYYSSPASAQVYDSPTGTFTASGKMTRDRLLHTATLLRDGTVLFAGSQYPAATAGAEIYDPAVGTFSTTGDMTSPRFLHTATLLSDGTVLMAGGYSAWAYSIDQPLFRNVSAELYIPSVLVPLPVVTGLRFDRTSVVAGTSYSVNVSGSDLTPQAFFDVRFTRPGSNDSAVVLNWQKRSSSEP